MYVCCCAGSTLYIYTQLIIIFCKMRRSPFLIIYFYVMVNSLSTLKIDFSDIIPAITAFFDTRYPSASMKVNFTEAIVGPHFWENSHNKRCISIESAQAIEDFFSFRWESLTGGNSVLVSTPCLGSDSIGNRLTSYFENVVCADKVGMHYISLAKVWEPKTGDRASPFIAALPSSIRHPNPSNKENINTALKKVCRCVGSCHERLNSVWYKGLDVIRPILNTALSYHLEQSYHPTELRTVVTADDLSNVPVGTSLPFIPHLAIHYRCSDNFVGHYGFLPFSKFVDIIAPEDENQTMYVLAENKNRKTTPAKRHLVEKCDGIFNAMFNFLTSRYPRAKVLIRRGDDLYLDMARLSYAKKTICSVSSFCLWPAILNNGSAHFPRTKLILAGDATTNLGPHFHWIKQPQIIHGVEALRLSGEQLRKQLHGKS